MKTLNFNNYLDEIMERLMKEDITTDDLEKEIRISKAVCQIAEKKIADKKINLEAIKLLSNGDIDKAFISNDFKHLIG